MRLAGLQKARLGLTSAAMDRAPRIHDLFLADFGLDAYVLADSVKSLGDMVTFAQNSTERYAPDSDGLWHRFEADTLPQTDLGAVFEPESTNFVRTMEATTDATTPPDNWTVVAPSNGVTLAWTGTRTLNGVVYAKVKISGTATAAGGCSIRSESTTQVEASSGQTWSQGWNIGIESGDLTGFNLLRLSMREGQSGGSQVKNQDGASILGDVPGAAANPRRFTQTATLDGGENTGRVVGFVNFGWPNGAEIDCEFLLALPMLEQRDVPSMPFLGQIGSPSVTLHLPDKSARDLTLIFDDDSTQVLSAIGGGDYALDPATLDRPQVKVIDWRSV